MNFKTMRACQGDLMRDPIRRMEIMCEAANENMTAWGRVVNVTIDRMIRDVEMLVKV